MLQGCGCKHVRLLMTSVCFLGILQDLVDAKWPAVKKEKRIRIKFIICILLDCKN